LHRAFSIFVFNSKCELLLQKRAENKYHSGGLWSNTCCSHPKKGRNLKSESHKRLKEEMGFDCNLREIFSFRYRVDLDNGFIENEYDHLFFGLYDKSQISPNPQEVSGYKWVNINDLKGEIIKNPDNYSYWLKFVIQNHFNKIESSLNDLISIQ
jgi:isopentenyl-diphosphate Delta-isomerase